MSVQQSSIAAATAVVGYDLLRDEGFKSAQFERRIVAAGLTGSAAAGDTEVELFIGSVSIGTLFNSATGFNNRDSLFRLGENVPPNAAISAVVRDAPATNPINIALDVVRGAQVQQAYGPAQQAY
tara:strand:+ start:2301 stop:2675 length:375 start_codon:yes stop_codon:yes gene_type:complete